MSETTKAPHAAPRLLDRSLLGGAILTLVLGATQYGFELFPKAYLSLVDPIVWLAFLIWCVRTLVLRWRPLRDWPILTTLFLLACALSCVWAGNRLNALKDVVQFVEYFLAGYLVLTAVSAQAAPRRILVYTFMGVSTAVVAMAGIQYGDANVTALAVRGTFGNRNVLGGFLCLALPFALAFLLGRGTVWLRAWAAVLLVAGAGVLLSGGAAMGIAAGCIIVAAWHSRTVLVGTALAIVLCACLAAPLLPRNNQEVAYQSTACFDDSGEINSRYPEWQAATIMTLENPWTGVGIGNYQANIGMYYGMLPNRNEAAEPDTQNLYLVLASSIGIPGLLCFVAMLTRFLVVALRSSGSGGPVGLDRSIARGVAGALVAFAIAAVWSPLLVRGMGIPLAFMFALAATGGTGQKLLDAADPGHDPA